MRGDTPRRVVACLLATASCHTVADNAVDPAWSPDGAHISFVNVAEQPPTNPDDWPTQYAWRSLVVADTDGTSPHDIPNTSGAGSPQWLDNDNVVFVHDGGLTLVDEASGQQAELVHAIGLAGDIPPPNAYEATDLVGYAWTNSFDLQPTTNAEPPTTGAPSAESATNATATTAGIEPADSLTPAAGVCGGATDGVGSVFPGGADNVPSPRCLILYHAEKLRVANTTHSTVSFVLGKSYRSTLGPGRSRLFPDPVGDHLAPGVHELTITSTGATVTRPTEVVSIWVSPHCAGPGPTSNCSTP